MRHLALSARSDSIDQFRGCATISHSDKGRLMSLPPQVCRISGIAGNQYLILEPGELTLVDAGLPGNHKKVLQVLAHLGFRPSDLRRILITHADGDHYGALNPLCAATGARVCASAIEADAIRRGTSSRKLHPTGLARLAFALAGLLVHSEPATVDETLLPGALLPLLGGLDVLDTAGHTPGHLSFYSPSTGVLFAGDSIIVRVQALGPSGGGNTWDLDLARSALERQVALRPSFVCAGHGYWEEAGEQPI
jgi:glyoxylase-like metal-dependent hydrolase (beta-lactamase superfamily II)